jgi:hypothetical protein
MKPHTMAVLAFLALVASARTAAAQPTGCTTVSPGIADGTFEAGDPWPQWAIQSSSTFGTPICSLANCGTGPGGVAAPFAGSNWTWFGDTTQLEAATIGQGVVIPPGPFLFLRFQLRIGAVAAPFSDTLTISVSGMPVATFTEPSVAEATYTQRLVDVTPFANGVLRTVVFTFAHPAGAIADFTVDDIELISCTTPVELTGYEVR